MLSRELAFYFKPCSKFQGKTVQGEPGWLGSTLGACLAIASYGMLYWCHDARDLPTKTTSKALVSKRSMMEI